METTPVETPAEKRKKSKKEAAWKKDCETLHKENVPCDWRSAREKTKDRMLAINAGRKEHWKKSDVGPQGETWQ